MPPTPTVEFVCGPFAPRYDPVVVPTKERNLQKQQDMCEGEYIYDLGGKNRKINVDGWIHRHQFGTWNSMLEMGEPMEMVSEKWSGEVLVERGKLDEELVWDGSVSDWACHFVLDLVSTGRDERGETNYGIIGGGGGGGGGGGNVV